MRFEETREEEYVSMGYEKEDEYATKYVERHIIELQKFKKKNPEIDTKLEQWLWLFIGGEEEKMRKIGRKNREIEKIDKKLASMSLSREERNNYEFRRKAILDETSAIDYATKKGLAQGLEQGIKQGIQYNIQYTLKEVVQKMLNEKLDVDLISRITGLKKEQIIK